MHNDNPGDPPATQALVVHGRDVPRLVVHSWAREGHMHSVWPGDAIEVPPDGTRIGVKIINFPIGSVREIYLDTGARTHPHGSYEDVLFYQIDGRRVQMCEDQCGTVEAGDVSFEPHGVEHSTYQLVGGLFVEFALPAPERRGGRGVWIAASEARVVASAVVGDASLDGPEAYWAPHDAPRHERRVFSVPGHDLIETVLAAGGMTAPRREVHDTLFYVVRGSLSFRVGANSFAVEAGDSLRAPAGEAYAFVARDDCVVIQAAARAMG
jgi:quercetin dioxygenase-like cupin family protein